MCEGAKIIMRQRTYSLKWSVFLFVSVLVLGLAGSANAAAPYTVPATTDSPDPLQVGQPVTLRGAISVIHGDPPHDSGEPPRTKVLLTDDAGTVIELALDLHQFDLVTGQRVQVTGKMMPAAAPTQEGPAFPVVEVASVQVIDSTDALSPTVTGSVPWVNVLCRFSDSTGDTPHPASWYDPLFANVYPGIDHYWREISYNAVNIAGTTTHGWYNLPKPRADYIINGEADLDALAADCTAAAEADIYFPDYQGINLMFNQQLDCCAWGGSHYIQLDGQWSIYRMTWLPPWAQRHSTVTHEMGHGFGLPHSTGPADNPPVQWNEIYISQWDVMSSASGTCTASDPEYDCIAPGTISYHIDLAGWMPPSRLAVVNTGEKATITLERLDQPVSGTDPLMIKIPIGGSSIRYYTVEVRQLAGYDQNVPGAAVVIHDVDKSRSGNGGDAYVVDAVDGNDNVNDAGAMWLPGEVYEDVPRDIYIEVLNASGSTFTVYVENEFVIPPPDAPSDLAGVGVSRSQIDLSWTDSNPDETEYSVELSPNGISNWQVIGTVPGELTDYTFSHTGLDCDPAYFYRVRAYRGGDGMYSAPSNVVEARTQDCLLATPVLVSPANGLQTDDNAPLFTWGAVPGAVTYRIQIDDNSNFSSPEQDQTVTTVSFQSDILSDKATYYWRVRALDWGDESSRWSGAWSVVLGENRLAAPQLRSPKDRANVPDRTPRFSWKRVRGADSYVLQISQVPDFSSIWLSKSVTRPRYTLGDDLGKEVMLYQTYYWRVLAQDAAGNVSAWSVPHTLTITIQKSPSDGAYTTDTTPTFKWSTEPGATAYQFQLDDNPSFSSPLNGSPEMAHSYTPDTPLAYGTYYWRVNVSGFSYPLVTPTWMVTITPGVPAKPDLLTPANKWQTDDPALIFTWDDVSNGDRYQIQIDDQPNFKSPEQDVTLGLGELSYTAAPLTESGGYYWRVRALNEFDVAGKWSSRWFFTLTGPDSPSLSSPANQSTSSNMPAFSWAPADGGSTYHIRIGDSKQFDTVVQETTVAGLTYDATSLPDGKYYWQVRAINAADVAGAWSPPWWFVVDTAGPSVPALKKPKDQSTTPDTTPVFKWKPVNEAIQYRIQVSATSDFADPVMIDATTPLTTYQPPAPLAYGSYYWRVQARDSADHWSGWGAVYSVTVTILKSPAADSATTDNTPKFKWYPVKDAVEYHIQIATNSAFSPTVTDTVVTSTAYIHDMPRVYGPHYWRVRVNVAGSGYSEWMPVWMVTITPKPPKKTRLLWPANRTIFNDNTPSFAWEPVTDGYTYQIQIDDDKQFGSPEQNAVGSVGELSYIATPLADGKYYWRVRALNSVGGPGKWSARWDFTLDTVAPDVPLMLAPVDGARVTNRKLRLEWGTVAGAHRYEIQLDTDVNFPEPVIDIGSQTNYQPPESLAQQVYYWRVRAFDAAGNVSAWSVYWTLNLVAGDTSLPVVIPLPDTTPVPKPTENPADQVVPPVVPVEPPVGPSKDTPEPPPQRSGKPAS